MTTLLLVAERNGPELMARIGMMRALNRHCAQPVPAPRRKPAKVYRLKQRMLGEVACALDLFVPYCPHWRSLRTAPNNSFALRS